VYVISGTPKGVSIYMGIAAGNERVDIPDMVESLRTSFEGNFLGSILKEVRDGETDAIKNIKLCEHIGIITGIPSLNEDDASPDKQDTQGIERLVNSLLGETWQLMIVAQAVAHEEIRAQLDQIYDITTNLSLYKKDSVQQSENSGWQYSETEGTSDSETDGTSRSDTRGRNKGISTTKGSSEGQSSGREGSSSTSGTNKTRGTSDGSSESRTTGDSNSQTKGENNSKTAGKTGGSSASLSRERTNQRVEALHTYITETLIKRYYLGQTKGLFRSAVYVSAEKGAIYDRLINGA
jgi:hypothetical protein